MGVFNCGLCVCVCVCMCVCVCLTLLCVDSRLEPFGKALSIPIDARELFTRFIFNHKYHKYLYPYY